MTDQTSADDHTDRDSLAACFFFANSVDSDTQTDSSIMDVSDDDWAELGDDGLSDLLSVRIGAGL